LKGGYQKQKKMTYTKYDEEDDEVVGNSNVKLIMTKKLKDKLDYLSNYKPTEVGGFLTYEKIEQDKDGEVSVVLNDILIPPQEAKSTEVDIDGEGQVELRKEFGDKCLKIIGHFHSHNTMGCFFSSTDEDMMKSYSENKPFCIFIVGSEGEHLIRLVLRNSINNVPYEMKIENVEFEVEADDSIKDEMEIEIKKKVKEPEVKETATTTSNSNSDETKKVKKEIEKRVKYFQHQNHKVKVVNIYKYYAKLISEEFKTLNPIIEKGELINKEEHYNVVVELGEKNKAKEFMVDVKAFLIKTIMFEREKAEAKKDLVVVDGDGEVVEDSELAQYLDELDEEELEEMEMNSGRCNWKSYQDRTEKTIREKMRKDLSGRDDFDRRGYMDYCNY
jgi:proteasome lid subunit RPN8/RPN11